LWMTHQRAEIDFEVTSCLKRLSRPHTGITIAP
jgi:hypothetical protein